MYTGQLLQIVFDKTICKLFCKCVRACSTILNLSDLERGQTNNVYGLCKLFC